VAVTRSTSERGYGGNHQTLRAKWEPIVRAGGVMCARQGPKCIGKPLDPDQPWDLGHTDDRTAYTGPECVPCNRGAGGANGARVVNERRQMTVHEW
jgi:hypothetical protein